VRRRRSDYDFGFVDTLWAAVAAIAAAVQTAVIVCAAAYALGQVREARRARNLTTLIYLNGTIDADSAHEDRRKLFNELPDDLTKELSPENYALVYRIVRLFTFIGDLVAKGLLDFELIAATHARPISRIFQRLEPWVLKQHDMDPTFAQALVSLGRRCMAWDIDRHGYENRAVFYRHVDSVDSQSVNGDDDLAANLTE
jgi:hypothetical protein